MASTFTCETCNRTFPSKTCLNKHIKHVHEKSSNVICEKCNEQFSTSATLRSHLPRCKGKKIDQTEYICEKCSRVYSNKRSLTYHMKSCNGNVPSSSSSSHKRTANDSIQNKPSKKKRSSGCVMCSVCSNCFLSKQQRDQHVAEDHTDITPLELYMEYIPSYVSEDVNLKKCIEDNIHLIMTPHLNHPESKKLNYYKFTMLSLDDVTEQLHDVFQQHGDSIKLNISQGYILQNTDTNVYSFFYPGGNETLLPQPIGISTYENVMLKNQDFLQHVHLQRPNTKYRVVHITNVLYTTYNRGHVIGSDEIVLPSYILKKKSIISLVKSSNKKPYKDHLCMFRALAVQREGRLDVEGKVKQLFSLWKTNETMQKDF